MNSTELTVLTPIVSSFVGENWVHKDRQTALGVILLIWFIILLYYNFYVSMLTWFCVFPVGPPYCFRFKVKFYSSEPNNLHEELTRWVGGQDVQKVRSESVNEFVDEIIYKGFSAGFSYRLECNTGLYQSSVFVAA